MARFGANANLEDRSESPASCEVRPVAFVGPREARDRCLSEVEHELLDRQPSRKEPVMLRTLFSRLAVVLTVLGLLGAMAMPASAGRPEKIDIYEEFDEVLCGIPVHDIIEGTVILHIQDYTIQADDPTVEDDFWIGVIQQHFKVTYTNAAGVSLFQFERNTLQEDSIVDNGDGTWTYTYTLIGQQIMLKGGNGTVLVDVGRTSYSFLLYFGDLSTQADNSFISADVTQVVGPHPIHDSDFALFCEAVTDILG